jgi:hypothetical protein
LADLSEHACQLPDRLLTGVVSVLVRGLRGTQLAGEHGLLRDSAATLAVNGASTSS